MTRRTQKLLTITAGISLAGSLTVFSASWYGADLPMWARDVRWMLILAAMTIIIIVPLDRQMASSTEAFNLGMMAGEKRGRPRGGTGKIRDATQLHDMR